MNSSSAKSLESFNHSEIVKEEGLEPELYAGLAEEALYTSNDDLASIFDHPSFSGTWVDLGAGDGRSIIQYAQKFPGRKSIGIEFSNERVDAGLEKIRNQKLGNANLLKGDLLFVEIPKGDIYFLYFPTGPVLDRILSVLSRQKNKFKIVAIESHGDLLPRLQRENWLNLASEIPLLSARHYPKAQIFESNGLLRSPELSFYDLSFQHKHLLISEDEKTWIGESFGMIEIRKDEFNLVLPPRTIRRDSVLAIIEENDLSGEILSAVKLRRGSPAALIRKIFLSPSFSIEISTGETIEWNQIKDLHQE